MLRDSVFRLSASRSHQGPNARCARSTGSLDQSKPRIRFVWNYLDWGGANVYLLAIMKEARGEWDIEVLLPQGSSPDILNMIAAAGIRHRLIDALLDKEPAPT